jgi:hypothetical protein
MSRELTIEPDGEVVESAPHARARRRRALAAGLVAVACIAGFVGWQRQGPGNEAIDSSTAITADQLEQEYGVRLGVIGLLASGGLVELKFQVTDADKATGLFGSVEDMPVLAVEGTEHVLQSAKGMKHNIRILDGASYFFLYTNVANVLHAGSEVAFVINGVRIPDLVVQQ